MPQSTHDLAGLTFYSSLRAAQWQLREGIIPLLPLQGWTAPAALAINQNGQICGSAINVTQNGGVVVDTHMPVIWDSSNLPPRSLGEFRYPSAKCESINNLGYAVGNAKDADGNEHPLLWQGGVVTALPLPPDAVSARVYSINDSDQIVGSYTDTSSRVTALVWNGGPSYPQELTNLGGYSEALSINNTGQVAGVTAQTSTAVRHAFRLNLSSNGTPDVLIGYSSTAKSINLSGIFVGDGYGTDLINVSGPIPFLYLSGESWYLQEVVPVGTAPFWGGNETINNRQEIVTNQSPNNAESTVVFLRPIN